MEATAEGLWGLADYLERRGEIGKAIKCLEAICQSEVSFLPIVEIKTRLRIATLLSFFYNVLTLNHTRTLLEKSLFVLAAAAYFLVLAFLLDGSKSLSVHLLNLKCRAFSLLSQCYHLVGASPTQKQILLKGLELTATFGDGFAARLWECNFNSQLANTLIVEGDNQGSISCLEHGYMRATEMCYPELQVPSRVKFDEDRFFTKKCHVEEKPNNYAEGAGGVCRMTYFGNVKRTWIERLELAPPPIDGEWLPKSAIYALVDLIVVVCSRPKGLFKECVKRIDQELVAMDLTRSEFLEAQEALAQMINWFVRFPTILQTCESMIAMLRGQYAHSVGCYKEATFHFIEASKLAENRSMQGMCHVYAAISYICIGDAESSSKALDLVGPVFRAVDSFVGIREKTCVLFAYGFLLMRQQNLQDARVRLASGLQTTHTHLGNLQLVSQYLTVLGNLALALRDTGQAKEILRSSLTLAKKLYDVPTQIWVLSNLTALYQQSGEKEHEMENLEYQKKKVEELQRRISDAASSAHHNFLIDKNNIQIHQSRDHDIKRSIDGPSVSANLDIPESVGLVTPQGIHPSSRIMDLDIGRIGRRKV
ncbi:hypothetical protein Leryth_013131 [Lithospermum erythrorhizon]|nr:hypothetical protein Leryth_013131 [Lithospermum erythrorhizon]